MRSVVCRTPHAPTSHIVAAVGGHHGSSHRVGILSVSSCVRRGVVVIAFNGHVDVKDILLFMSQDVCLNIDLWHTVLFRKHPEQCFIQNHVVAPTETVSEVQNKRRGCHRVVFAASWNSDPASICSREFLSTRALLVSFWSVFHESKELP